MGLRRVPPARSLLTGVERNLYDRRFRRRAAEVEPESREGVVVVDVDRRSVDKLGKFSRWPLSYHAQVIDALAGDGAAAVGFDFIFAPDRDPAENEAFLEATRRAGNVHHGLAFDWSDPLIFLNPMTSEPEAYDWRDDVLGIDPSRATAVTRYDRMDDAFPELANAAAGNGFVNVEPDPDGVVRTVPLVSRFLDHAYPSLSLSLVLGAWGVPPSAILRDESGALALSLPDGRSVRLPTDRRGHLAVNYQGGFRTFRYVSFYDVLAHRVPPGLFEGKVVLVGASLPGLYDLRVAPVAEAFPGVEIHANAVYQLLASRHLPPVPGWVSLALSAALALAVATGSLALRPWLALVLLVGYCLGTVVLGFEAFERSERLLNLTGPMTSASFAYLLAIFYRYAGEEREVRRVQGYFRQYVSPAVVEQMVADPTRLRLGGERKVLTVLYSDIRSFTAISEQVEPEALSTFLNLWLTRMTDAILARGGTLDKYIGDCVVAFFGAPVALPDHARSACLAALDMRREIESIRSRTAHPILRNVTAGIGLNTGDVVVGNMGSERIFDYTALGDNMNLGSRVEGLTKHYRVGVLAAEATVRAAGEGFRLREVDTVAVKGRQEGVTVFELLGSSEEAGDGEAPLVTTYAEALTLYRAGRLGEAAAAFRSVLEARPDDGPAAVLLGRCERLLAEGVPPGWTGVWRMEEK